MVQPQHNAHLRTHPMHGQASITTNSSPRVRQHCPQQHLCLLRRAAQIQHEELQAPLLPLAQQQPTNPMHSITCALGCQQGAVTTKQHTYMRMHKRHPKAVSCGHLAYPAFAADIYSADPMYGRLTQAMDEGTMKSTCNGPRCRS